ncbi:MAG TPA: hypothetical protein VMI10_05060 [Terriglobales bacterium]|nr:hypothetical protein [Terriglobales bacterium]
MKITMLWISLLLASAALAQQGTCYRCKVVNGDLACVDLNLGLCKCAVDGGICDTCGICLQTLGCTEPCPQVLTSVSIEPVQQTAKPQLDPTIEEAWLRWPWLTSVHLADEVGAISPPLGKLVEAEQYIFSKPKCKISIARGGVFALKDIHVRKGPWVEWESVVDTKAGVIHYHLTSGYDRYPNYLDIAKDKWRVIDHNQVIAEGKF